MKTKANEIVWMLIGTMLAAFTMIIIGWPANSPTCKIFLILAGVMLTISVWCAAEISYKLKELENV